jgi:hypothetical protein
MLRRRLLLAATAALAVGVGVLPVDAYPFVGESVVASAATRVRGSDAKMFQLEVVVAAHRLGPQTTHELRVRLLDNCGEHGCSGPPAYSIPLDRAKIDVTADGASVTTTFAGQPLVVTWKPRTKVKPFTPGAPETDTRTGATVLVGKQDRSAPAVIRIGSLTCKSPTAAMRTYTGVTVREPANTDSPPSKLPKGFFPTARSKPRCF